MPNNIAFDFDYELRHPSHGDQSVHNPHKGGGYQIGSAEVATPEQAAARMVENSRAFESRGGSAIPGSAITRAEAKQQAALLEGQSAFPPSTEPSSHGGFVSDPIAASNAVYRMPDGPAKDLARQELDLMYQKQSGIEHTVSTLKLRKDEGKGGQDVEVVNNFYAKDATGKVVAGATVSHGKSGDTELFYLGSTGEIPGAGSALIRQTILSAAARNSRQIVIRAESDSRPFYRAMGFKGDQIMTMDADVIAKIAAAIK